MELLYNGVCALNIPIGSVWRSKKSDHDAFAIVILKINGNVIIAASKYDIEAKKSIHKFSVKRLIKEYIIEVKDNENDV